MAKTGVGEEFIDDETNFEELGLDARILKAIEKECKWDNPTLVQASAIPLVLEGKDILARARTGSGKTAAYTLPILQKILTSKDFSQNSEQKAIRFLILVPTRELVHQLKEHFNLLTRYCSDVISFLSLTGDDAVMTQKARLSEFPDILITTPKVLNDNLQKKNLNLKSLELIVIDEADFIFSFGFEADIHDILKFFPKIYQGILMSATLSLEVDSLKRLILHSPAILRLEDPETTEDAVQTTKCEQFEISCSEEDKFLIVYVLIKLRLIKGKTIIFVNDISKAFRLKLFFERFSLHSAVLNAELPQNSRYHILQEFNKGIFDLLIATDASHTNTSSKEDKKKKKLERLKQKKIKQETGEDGESIVDVEIEAKEYGVSRGIDFKYVKNVVNFDFPETLRNYIHRIGRTARGGQSGTALSFVTADDKEEKFPVFLNKRKTKKIKEENLDGDEVEQMEEDVEIEDEVQEENNAEFVKIFSSIKPFSFKMELIDGFRYRVEDALRSVTMNAIKQARIKDIKHEIVNSEKLKSHFEENPKDLQELNHTRHLQPARVKQTLKEVPDYLMPSHMSSGIQGPALGKKRKRRVQNDPLKNFSFKKRGKMKSEGYRDKKKRKVEDGEEGIGSDEYGGFEGKKVYTPGQGRGRGGGRGRGRGGSRGGGRGGGRGRQGDDEGFGSFGGRGRGNKNQKMKYGSTKRRKRK